MTELKPEVNHIQDIFVEVRAHLIGRNKLIDTLLPPILFLGINYLWGLSPALYAAVGSAVLISLLRLLRGQNLRFAIGGLATVFLAAFFAWWMSRAKGFFLPSIISNTVFVAALGISFLIRKPLAAWLSQLSRRWPSGWYRHPRVQPAYMEVTLFWALVLAVRLWIQLFLYQSDRANVLGAFQLITGTPFTILLLILSYLYGIWRLGTLRGPSVVEYKKDEDPPWQSQRRGF
jgi:hypothetical protein